MDEAQIKHLGSPAIKLMGLQIWIIGRQFPNSNDYWDANWLNVVAHCGTAGASVWIRGPIIHLREIDHWLATTKEIQKTLTGEAKLDCIEPNLSVTLEAAKLGHITMRVSITPDHMTQTHLFQFDIDQTYLGSLISQCSAALQEYPMLGK